MTFKASGRPALILAAGLLVCLAAPSQAATGAAATASSKSEATATSAKHARHSTHHPKKYAQRKSGSIALRSPADKNARVADEGDNSFASPAIPPSVANANAQMASADTPTGSARAMSARANEILQAAPAAAEPAAEPAAEAQVVSPDQLNDLDRALPDSTPPAPALTMASAEAAAPAPAAPAPPAAASSNESSTWDETSLIGKIFIGFGALLTMASAARMFMA